MVLTREAWLNVEADSLAKSKATTPHIGPTFFKLLGNPWACYASELQIVQQLDSTLQMQINGQDTTAYWMKQCNLQAHQQQSIDWFSLGCAMRSVPLGQHQWASKQMSGHFAHGKNMARWHQRLIDKCLQCDQPKEDKSHITQCQQEAATAKWNGALNNLKQCMKAEQSDPQLIELLITELQAWHNSKLHTHTSPLVQ